MGRVTGTSYRDRHFLSSVYIDRLKGLSNLYNAPPLSDGTSYRQVTGTGIYRDRHFVISDIPRDRHFHFLWVTTAGTLEVIARGVCC